MGSAVRADFYVTPENYLAGELLREEKHEYLAGVIYAMAGPTLRHDRIANNLLRELGNQLRGRPCEVFSPDVKVRIRRETATFFYYPDVTVDCTNPSGDQAFLEHPRVIIEILSPATERIDRGEKRVNYQTLSSLDVYALVEQERFAVTLFRRVADGWTTEFLDAPNAVLALPTIECALPLAAIYERTGL